MAEQLANLYQTTIAINYTAGDGFISVTSASGAPSTGPFTLTILDPTGASILLLFRVSSVSGTTFTGSAEGTDANALATSIVIGTTLSVAAINNLFSGGSGLSFAQVYGDAFTTPTAAGFPTQEASGGASAISFSDDSSDGWAGVVLSANCTTNDTNIVAEVYAVPSTPYTLRMRFWPGGAYNQYQFAGGIALFNSGTGTLVVFGLFTRNQAPSGGIELRVGNFNSTSSFNGSVFETLVFGAPGRAGLVDILIEDDGVNRTFFVIPNGSLANKVQVYQTATNDFTTPTHVGIFVAPGHNQTPSGPIQIKVVDWTQGT